MPYNVRAARAGVSGGVARDHVRDRDGATACATACAAGSPVL